MQAVPSPRRTALRMAAAMAMLVASGVPARAEPLDPAGNVGATNYTTLPFQKQIYGLCWNCSPKLEPGELFFQANPGSVFNDAQLMAGVRRGSAAMEARGVIPSGGAQRWEDTYAASFPAGTFAGEPSWVQNDRNLGLSTMPEFVAWRDFITRHPQYWDMANDGGTMPSDPNYFRSWGAQWGHISPLTPLDPADCPPDMAKPGTPGIASCNWGDSYAYRWGLTAARTGGYGIILSDFTDSQPARPSTRHNFNPRVIAAFARANKLSIQGGTIAEQANWIVAQAFNAWNDDLARGYGRFYQALAVRLDAATGRRALIADQCGGTAATRRDFGTDARIFTQHMNPQNYLCFWDDHVVQTDRAGPVQSPPMQELAGFVLAASREPLMRNGANLEADDASYWRAIAKFYPGLSAADQKEVGTKLLRRLWAWSAWAHVADRAGKLRRALAFTSRDYWDNGSLAALDPLTSLIQSVVPTRPFGPALYYSVAVERATEAELGRKAGAGHSVGAYLPPARLQEFLDAGGSTGYYVSDAGLPKIGHAEVNAPSAWVVLDAGTSLPAGEASALAAIAPVVTSAAALAALPDQPLRLPPGLAGFGFYDQARRLILVVSNPSTAPGAEAVAGSVALSGLGSTGSGAAGWADGDATQTDLLTGHHAPLAIARGKASLALSVPRWDTQIFAITPPGTPSGTPSGKRLAPRP